MWKKNAISGWCRRERPTYLSRCISYGISINRRITVGLSQSIDLCPLRAWHRLLLLRSVSQWHVYTTLRWVPFPAQHLRVLRRGYALS